MIETQSVIQIGTWEGALGIAAVLIGMGAAWGTLRQSLIHIEKTLEEIVQPDIKELRDKYFDVRERVGILEQDFKALKNH